MLGSELLQVVNAEVVRPGEIGPGWHTKAEGQLDDRLSISVMAQSPSSDKAEVKAACERGAPLAVPDNFHHVLPGLYRSSFPRPEHFEYLGRLGLKSVLTLTQEELPSGHQDFLRHHGIQHFHVGMPGNKVGLYGYRLLTV